MELLTDQPKITLLSIGHRPELEAFHTRKIELARRGKGAKRVRDFELAEPAKNIMRRWMRNWTGTAYRPAKPLPAREKEMSYSVDSPSGRAIREERLAMMTRRG